jgi:hypothetical protein
MRNAKIQNQSRKMKTAVFTTVAFATLTLCSAFAPATNASAKTVNFDLVRSPGLANTKVAPNATATVKIHSLGQVEVMRIKFSGLPPNTDFDLFVIQVPNPPFGLAHYQGDVLTDSHGEATSEFIGRFNIGSFIVAPGVAPAPADPFINIPGSIPDATQNPQTNPVQLYHLGLWFDNPADVVKEGGPNIITPFNSTHNAGVQVLNTSNFPDANGPLESVQ